MRIVNLIKKAITGGTWRVMYRTPLSDYCLAVSPENYWCADPFIFEVEGKEYIFVEQYDKKKDKGCIGYFVIDKGIAVNKGIIIDNPYHMSYPNVFKYNDSIYMIPESSANSTVDLYIAVSFPDRWEKVSTLIKDEKLVDSTVYCEENTYYLISYSLENKYEIKVYSLNLDNMSVRYISSKRYKDNIGRPAGRLYKDGSRIIRPAQDCSIKYGEAILLYEVDCFDNNGLFVEHLIKRITAKDYFAKEGLDRIHHITKSGNYEVVDAFEERFDLFRPIKILIRKNRK